MTICIHEIKEETTQIFNTVYNMVICIHGVKEETTQVKCYLFWTFSTFFFFALFNK